MNLSKPQIVIGAALEDMSTTTQNDISRLNGTSTNAPIFHRPGTLPTIDINDPTEPRKLLRKFSVAETEDNTYGFWSLALLRHILPRQRIINKLRQCSGNICHFIDYIRPPEESISQSRSETYLRVFVLLLLQERESEIGNFVRAGVCDELLPLRRCEGTEELELRAPKAPHNPLTCFSGWKTSDKEWLLSHQWRVLIPFFKLDGKGRAENYEFEDETILPWLPWYDENCTITASQPSTEKGGYAEVRRIRMDPSSHGFQQVLKSICLNDDRFALKVLHDCQVNNEKQYRNEVDQLKRFSGLIHDHLVTVLATFTLNKRYHFLFPYAECALDQYWEFRVPQPTLDLVMVQWISKQCLGLIEAMHTIHEPDHINLLPGVQRYGRHGDIKPDNILWFDTTKDPKGMLVISDMGLSALNSAKSRSNVPGRTLPGAPGYRPPECEVEGGVVSRAFDVWTMGCLFLELMTWLLGGQQMLREFQQTRMSLYINGTKNDIFFEIKKYRGDIPLVAQVKLQVTEWFAHLHAQTNCTQFIHDVLEIVEDKMVIVLAQDQRRATSNELKRVFQRINNNCTSEKSFGYCLRGIPKHLTVQPTTPVKVTLNDNAQNLVKHNGSLLELHEGRTRPSMTVDDLRKME